MTFRNKLSILILSIFLSFNSIKAQDAPVIPIGVPQVEYIKEQPKDTIEVFTEQNMLKYMDSLGMKYVKFAVGQAKHESAHYKSKLFRNQNNLFGMVPAEKRKTTAIGKRNGYAVYRNWKDSVLDYYLMQQWILKRHPTKQGYENYIFRNYARDPLYKKKMQKYR